MKHLHSMRLFLAAIGVIALPQATPAQPAPATTGGTASFTVFLRSVPLGQEHVSVVREADGWLIRGNNQLSPPLDVTTRIAEIRYDAEWRPTRLRLEGIVRGQDVSIATTFAGGQAKTEVTVAGNTSAKTDEVAEDTLVLPNAFLGSYAALARRLAGPGAEQAFRAYIAPQGEVTIRVEGTFPERIETPREAIDATRYALVISNPPPVGDLQMSLWADATGALLRLSVPAQTLEVAREDIASAATRTAAFSVPGDEAVRIPAAGFGLAATVTRPANAAGRLPAVILVGGSGPVDRDGYVAGIPVLGQIARDLVEAGFVVVRYDKRGVGQSGGRAETSTIADYADDVRAIFKWLEKDKGVDKRRIGVVGHSEGAWVAMRMASREKRVAAVVLVAGASVPGNELILEQQRHLLERLKTPDEERQAKIALQEKINAAAMDEADWSDIPEELRRAADNPWFQSFLAFDPARVMRDVRQPVLVVQGERDTQVPPHHADRLAELARARRRDVPTDLARIPGVNHLLVPATTGEVDEYGTLSSEQVSAAATAAIATWLAKVMG